MYCETYGSPHLPVLVLLHGGGLAPWSLRPVANLLQTSYYVVLPAIDGHGVAAEDDFISIQAFARKVITYIDEHFNGRIHALGGLSLGAQIAVEILAQRTDIAAYALIESALVCPVLGIRTLAAPIYRMCYGLIRHRWFSRIQASALNLPQEFFEDYYQDSKAFSEASLIAVAVSNGTYTVPASWSRVQASVLIIVGGREIHRIKKSARILHENLQTSRVYEESGLMHGELSLAMYRRYASILLDWCRIATEACIQKKM